jgi:hypothetical protein
LDSAELGIDLSIAMILHFGWAAVERNTSRFLALDELSFCQR